MAYYKKMPWLMLDPEINLGQRLGVMSIPKLCICKPDGTVTTWDGVGAVYGDVQGTQFPWDGYVGNAKYKPVLIVIYLVAVLVFLGWYWLM